MRLRSLVAAFRELIESDFDPSEHPRDDDGKFASKAGGRRPHLYPKHWDESDADYNARLDRLAQMDAESEAHRARYEAERAARSKSKIIKDAEEHLDYAFLNTGIVEDEGFREAAKEYELAGEPALVAACGWAGLAYRSLEGGGDKEYAKQALELAIKSFEEAGKKQFADALRVDHANFDELSTLFSQLPELQQAEKELEDQLDGEAETFNSLIGDVASKKKVAFLKRRLDKASKTREAAKKAYEKYQAQLDGEEEDEDELEEIGLTPAEEDYEQFQSDYDEALKSREGLAAVEAQRTKITKMRGQHADLRKQQHRLEHDVARLKFKLSKKKWTILHPDEEFDLDKPEFEEFEDEEPWEFEEEGEDDNVEDYEE